MEPTDFDGTRLQLRDVTAEFDQIRQHAGFIDRSTNGRILVTGGDRLDLLHRLSTNDLLRRKPGEVVSTVFTTEKGRIVDYAHLAIHAESLLLIISAGNEAAVASWIDKFTIMDDVKVEIVTNATSMFSVIGPEAPQYVHDAIGVLPEPGYLSEASVAFGKVVVLCRTEKEVSICDIVVPAENGHYLLELLRKSRCPEIIDETFECLRISRGIPGLPNELNEHYNPFDVGLLDAVSFSKGCYIGQEVIARLDTYQKAQKALYGLVSDANNPMRMHAGDPVMAHGGEAGIVTSASLSSVRGKQIAMAVLKKDAIHADESISVVHEGASQVVQIEKFPIDLI